MEVEKEIEGVLTETAPDAGRFGQIVPAVPLISTAVAGQVLIKVKRKTSSEPWGHHCRQHRMQTVARPGIEVKIRTLQARVIGNQHHIVGSEVV